MRLVLNWLVVMDFWKVAFHMWRDTVRFVSPWGDGVVAGEILEKHDGDVLSACWVVDYQDSIVVVSAVPDENGLHEVFDY